MWMITFLWRGFLFGAADHISGRHCSDATKRGAERIAFAFVFIFWYEHLPDASKGSPFGA